MIKTMDILENTSSPCCVPEEEIEVGGSSQLCIAVKHNTAVPDFSEIGLSKGKTGQGRSELCIIMKSNYTSLPDNIVTGRRSQLLIYKYIAIPTALAS